MIVHDSLAQECPRLAPVLQVKSTAVPKASSPNAQALHEGQTGRLKTLVVRGNATEIAAKVSAANPVYFDILPLSLEEIFIYELGGVNYEVKNILL